MSNSTEQNAKVYTYASELGYGDFCKSCIQLEADERGFQHLEEVCETENPCARCSVQG